MTEVEVTQLKRAAESQHGCDLTDFLNQRDRDYCIRFGAQKPPMLLTVARQCSTVEKPQFLPPPISPPPY